ncbi:MAG: DNA polymerase domain-containing protein [Candidatus Aenigmatarchaeota archaeon]
MNVQILDLDYVIVNERPIIRIFGRNEQNKSTCVFYKGVEPFFYTTGDVEKILGDDPQIVRVENVKRKDISVNKEIDIKKVTIKNPSKTPDLRTRLVEAGADVFEADILFKYRFMADNELRGSSWISVTGGTAATGTVLSENKIEAKQIKPIKKPEETDLKYAAFDIECVPTKAGEIPDARSDPIIMIAFAFNKPYKGQNNIVLSTRPDPGVTSFATEKEMLVEFINIINNFDADIITGFNVNNFDIPYVLERMKKKGVRPVFGRCASKQVMAKKMMNRHKIIITGRVIVDSYELVKKDFSLKRYNLNTVAKELLGEEKIDVKHSEIEKLWNGNQEGYKKLIKYNLVDAELALRLVIKHNLVDKYKALSKVSGVLLQDSLDSGESTRIENFLLREFNKEGYIFPSKPSASEIAKRDSRKKVELKGGFVIEPIKDLHSDVVVLDFKSMYPSIIIGFNICPTTLSKEGDNLITTPGGVTFLPKNVKQGIIPRIVTELMSKRQSAKRRLKKEDDVLKKRVLDAEQWALKIMANAFYGYLGYSRAKVYNLDLGNAITSCGRDIIQKTKLAIENEYGYTVVYGDTDSVMVKLNTDDLEELGKIASRMAAEITKKLPESIELEFEKIFKRFLPLTKKRYVAWKFEPKGDGWKEGMEMKGIETVRRDWCELVSECMTNVISIILKKDDVKGAVKYFKSIINDLLEGRVPINKLVITKGMSKPVKSYVGIQPHIELVKKLQQRGEAPGIGDRIGYVIIKGTEMLSKRAEDPSYVIEKGLQIDSRYYIENQLLPPIERIFSGLKISKSELLGGGKQMGIFDALKKHEEKQVDKEIPIEQVRGFICTKCNKSYSRVPLVGACECGGNILFSSEKGPVGTVLVSN